MTDTKPAFDTCNKAPGRKKSKERDAAGAAGKRCVRPEDNDNSLTSKLFDMIVNRLKSY